MKQRIISLCVIVPIVLTAIIIGGWVFDALLLVLSLAAVWEMYKALKLADIRVMLPFSMSFAAVICIVVSLMNAGYDTYKLILPITFVFAILTFSFCLISKKYNIRDALITVALFAYPSLFIITLSLLMKEGRDYLLAGILASAIADTAAFFVGRSMGKKKLCPTISPHKTVAGAVGGEIFTASLMTVYGILMMLLIRRTGFDIVKFIGWSLFGIFGGCFSQFGDLTASAIKRYCGIKDFSNLIPGHGGIMDRLDSVMFSSALLYFFISLGIV